MVAVVVLVVTVGVVIFTGNGDDSSPATTEKGNVQDFAVKGKYNGSGNKTRYYNEGGRTVELFPFDPNTADSTQLLRLGLRPWQVRAIYKYRNKGGVYSRKTDFAQLYGLTKGEYRRLEPYIRIGEEYQPARTLHDAIDRKLYVRDTVKYPFKLKSGEHVSLNSADTAQLRRVPGIGRHFAKAIVTYRQRLGGYYNVWQLMEIEGFPEEALPYFTIDESHFRRININTATLSQLRQHPYIHYYLAKTITEHRRLHGQIHSLDELKLYRDFTPEVIERLKNYVEF